MQYNDYEIELLKEDGRLRARVARKDGRMFAIKGSDHPHMLLPWAETAFTYATEAEAIAEAKAIADYGER